MFFTPDRPQYLFVNIAPNRPWNQNRPESVTDALFETPLKAIGVRENATKTRRLGLSFVFSYLNGPPDQMDETLRRLLAQAQTREIPILIVLEGRDWWDYRADLWNWWNPAAPGYDPKNRENVEWADWGRKTLSKSAGETGAARSVCVQRPTWPRHASVMPTNASFPAWRA